MLMAFFSSAVSLGLRFAYFISYFESISYTTTSSLTSAAISSTFIRGSVFGLAFCYFYVNLGIANPRVFLRLRPA